MVLTIQEALYCFPSKIPCCYIIQNAKKALWVQLSELVSPNLKDAKSVTLKFNTSSHFALKKPEFARRNCLLYGFFSLFIPPKETFLQQ